MSEFLTAAVRYAKLGLAVIPLQARDKRPIFKDWTNLDRASVDTVERWWASSPNGNVGIVTGSKSGIFVLDVDPKNGGDLTYETLLMEHGQFPDTWQVITGTKGRHLYFRYPAFPVRNVAGLFQGIDIRGDGGQVVAPPSIHPNGTPYEWDGMQEIEDFPIAEAPQWLLELLHSRDGSTGKQGPSVIPQKIPHGTQHATLVSLAGMMRRMGLSAEEIAPTLQFVNEKRCEQPGAPANIAKIAESMMRYRPTDADLFAVATKLWRMSKKVEIEGKKELERLQVKPTDGLSVYRSQLSGPASVIDRMLYNGLTILAGKSKAGKSWIAMQLALSVAMNTRALSDRQVYRPGGVVYYSLEMGENRTAARLRQLLDREDITLQNIDFVWDCLPMKGGGIEQLNLLLESKRPSMVVIDTFLAFAKGKQKDGGDVMRDQYAEIDVLKKISEKHDTAFLLVHHTRKTGAWDDADAGVDLVAGSRGVTAACDSVWILRKQPDDIFSLDISGRDVEEQSLAIKFGKEPIGWKIIGEAEVVKRTNQEIEILKILETQGPQRSQRLVTLARLGLNHIEEILFRLQKDGRVAKNSGGAFCAITQEPPNYYN